MYRKMAPSCKHFFHIIFFIICSLLYITFIYKIIYIKIGNSPDFSNFTVDFCNANFIILFYLIFKNKYLQAYTGN